jgi:hypothetical protein
MRQQKITLGEMRESGVRGLLVYCADYKCSHSIKLEGAVVDRNCSSSGSEPTGAPRPFVDRDLVGHLQPPDAEYAGGSSGCG